MKNVQIDKRSGFTLIELLVVISIIGLMSGMFVVAYRGAEQESSTLKTRSTLQKIADVLTSRMEEYNSYPLTLRTQSGGLLPTNVVSGSANETVATLRERARLLLLRDLMRMEMPDHPDDLKYTTFWQRTMSSTAFVSYLKQNLPRSIATGLNSATSGSPIAPVKNVLTNRTLSLMNALSVNGVPRTEWDKSNANAELLFLIVESSEMDGSSAIELFGTGEIADTDNDGLNEFVDTFGVPIRWIRWPAWYGSSTRYYPDMLDPALIDQTNGRLLINSETIDRLGSDPGWGSADSAPGNGMTPLVVSAGLDRAFGIRFRDINRYPAPSSPPPPVGVFDGLPSYSSADIAWNPLFNKGYGANSVFTDPWFPRESAGATARQRMGELLNNSDVPEDGFNAASPFHARDNITNYDGTGVSL